MSMSSSRRLVLLILRGLMLFRNCTAKLFMNTKGLEKCMLTKLLKGSMHFTGMITSVMKALWIGTRIRSLVGQDHRSWLKSQAFGEVKVLARKVSCKDSLETAGSWQRLQPLRSIQIGSETFFTTPNIRRKAPSR